MQIEYIYGHHDVGNLESAIADRECNQENVAEAYANAMMASDMKLTVVDWAPINAAIKARWPSGLVRVKGLARNCRRTAAGMMTKKHIERLEKELAAEGGRTV